MNIIARILSAIFSPLLMPTYAVVISFWATYLRYTPFRTRFTVLAMTFAVTCMLPVIVIFILNKVGTIRDPRLNDRRDRLYPLLAGTLCILAVSQYLRIIHAPEWLSMFMFFAAVIAALTTIITFFWKISGHATALGGLCGFTFILCFRNYTLYNNELIFFGAVIAAGLVMTSRLLLQRHTLAQITAGFFNGAIWTIVPQLLLIH